MIYAGILGGLGISSNLLLDVDNSHSATHRNFSKYSVCLRKSGETKGKGLIGVDTDLIFAPFPL